MSGALVTPRSDSPPTRSRIVIVTVTFCCCSRKFRTFASSSCESVRLAMIQHVDQEDCVHHVRPQLVAQRRGQRVAIPVPGDPMLDSPFAVFERLAHVMRAKLKSSQTKRAAALAGLAGAAFPARCKALGLVLYPQHDEIKDHTADSSPRPSGGYDDRKPQVGKRGKEQAIRRVCSSEPDWQHALESPTPQRTFPQSGPPLGAVSRPPSAYCPGYRSRV
jgi:hypothetical protein